MPHSDKSCSYISANHNFTPDWLLIGMVRTNCWANFLLIKDAIFHNLNQHGSNPWIQNTCVCLFTSHHQFPLLKLNSQPKLEVSRKHVTTKVSQGEFTHLSANSQSVLISGKTVLRRIKMKCRPKVVKIKTWLYIYKSFMCVPSPFFLEYFFMSTNWNGA